MADSGVNPALDETAYNGVAHLTDPGGLGLTHQRELEPRAFRHSTQPEGPAYVGVDELDPETVHKLVAHLLRQDRAAKREERVFIKTGGQTDTSGNLILKVYDCPSGFEAHLSSFTAVIHPATTYNPSAPYAAAGSYMFLASGGQGNYAGGTVPTSLYDGLVAFAPTSAAGPILPGQWTFNDTNAPIFRTGEAIFFVIVGAAAIASMRIGVKARIQLMEL